MKYMILLLALLSTGISQAYTLKDIKSVCVEMEPNTKDTEYFAMALEMNDIETTATIATLKWELIMAKAAEQTGKGRFVTECVKGLKKELDKAKSKTGE
jgi:hypothetical protein